MSIDRIKELHKELKENKLKDGFIAWAAKHYDIHPLSLYSNWFSRFDIPSKRGFHKTLINDMEKYIKDNS